MARDLPGKPRAALSATHLVSRDGQPKLQGLKPRPSGSAVDDMARSPPLSESL